jgi:hypothetical protein
LLLAVLVVVGCAGKSDPPQPFPVVMPPRAACASEQSNGDLGAETTVRFVRYCEDMVYGDHGSVVTIAASDVGSSKLERSVKAFLRDWFSVGRPPHPADVVSVTMNGDLAFVDFPADYATSSYWGQGDTPSVQFHAALEATVFLDPNVDRMAMGFGGRISWPDESLIEEPTMRSEATLPLEPGRLDLRGELAAIAPLAHALPAHLDSGTRGRVRAVGHDATSGSVSVMTDLRPDERELARRIETAAYDVLDADPARWCRVTVSVLDRSDRLIEGRPPRDRCP